MWKTLEYFKHHLMEHQECAEAVIGELPPERGGAAAYNSKDLEYHIGGVFQGNKLSREIEKFYGDKKPLDILDFGCGAARILRYFAYFKPEHTYHACEVNEEAVALTSRISEKIDARVIKSIPPSPFDDETMDVVYAWSIWTHYDEPTGRAWLEELHRILRPGGLAMITVHTDELVDRYGTEPQLVAKMKERGGHYNAILHEYKKTGFSFWKAYPASAKDVGIDNETFGMAFVSFDYIKENWSDLFELMDRVPGAPKWQDIAILKKR